MGKVPENPASKEARRLRADIEVLPALISRELNRGSDRRVVIACAKVLREREDRLGGSKGSRPGS